MSTQDSRAPNDNEAPSLQRSPVSAFASR